MSAARQQQAQPTESQELRAQIAKRAARKRRARRQRESSVWFGLGMFGLVGWSVAIPTLVGVAIGLWIDKTWPSRYSWTLMLLVPGLALGCFNAWYWITRERRRIEAARRAGRATRGEDEHV